MPMRRRRAAVVALVGLALVLAVGAGLAYVGAQLTAPAATANGGLRVYRPKQGVPFFSGVVGYIGAVRGVAPRLPTAVTCDTPAGVTGLTPLPPGTVPTHPDGVAIGRHTTLPAMAARYLPANRPPDPRIQFPILAAVRYDVGGREIMVTTCVPAPQVASDVLWLGSREIVLRPGQFAYTDTSTAWHGTPPGPHTNYNSVVFADGGVLVTVESDLPPADVRAFARGVVVR